jgi:hypothetical protein
MRNAEKAEKSEKKKRKKLAMEMDVKGKKMGRIFQVLV